MKCSNYPLQRVASLRRVGDTRGCDSEIRPDDRSCVLDHIRAGGSELCKIWGVSEETMKYRSTWR